MNIILFTEENKQGYIDFVSGHEDGSFLQSWAWGDFQTSLGKTAVRYGAIENNTLVATVQLLITPIPHLPGFYLYAPYGPLVNEDANEDLVITELFAHIKEQHQAAWFIRFEPRQSLPLPGVATQRIQPSKSLITDIAQSTDELLAEMHPKTRYNIKVATKHSVKVTSEQIDLTAAIKLLTETSARQAYHSYPAGYYKKLISFFENGEIDCSANVYQAYLQDELLSAAVMIDHGPTRTYLFGGSSDANRNVMAPYAMHWQAMNDAQKLGLTRYDWWGIETATGKLPGFVQFKLKWGGEQVTYPPAIDVVQKRGWYAIYKVLRMLNRLF